MKRKRRTWQSWLLVVLASWLTGSTLILVFLEAPDWVPVDAQDVQLTPINEPTPGESNANGFRVEVRNTLFNRSVVRIQITIVLVIVGASLIFWVIEKGTDVSESSRSARGGTAEL
ncbi:MAG: hypothetical protein JXR37_18860 [Kiritimatiellae bacterium]|nr:hypothetical protein [Kiritimatiellia bacterium]